MKKTILTVFLSSLLVQLYAQSDSTYILNLQQCIDIATENNLSVKRSLLLKEGAKIDLTQSKANLLPNLNISGGYGYNWGRSIDPTTNQFINQQIKYSGVNGSANLTLFNWFRLANTVKQNRLMLESSDYDVDKAINDLSLNIVTYYLNVIFNRELLENARYQLESSQGQLARTRILVQGGALPRTSELELISQVATNEVTLINAQNDLDLAFLNLKQAMLIPVSSKIDLVIPDIDVEASAVLEVTAAEVYQAALGTMPEIQSAELQVQSAQRGIRIAEAAYTPTLSLNGNFSTNYSDAFGQRFIPDGGDPTLESTGLVTESGEEVLTFSPSGDFVDFGFSDQFENNLSRSLGLNLSIPIFNNLRVSSSVQRSKIALQQAEISVREQQNFLRQTIETAYNDAIASSKTYAASERQVEALEETFRSIENQYNLGSANFTEYQVASNNLFRAKSDLVRAKFDYIFKRKLLDFYQGKSLTY